VTLRGPWPAVPAGYLSLIDCELGAGVDPTVFGDYEGTMTRSCTAGVLGEPQGTCEPAGCSATYGGQDANGVQLSGYWPAAPHAGYSYLDCYTTAKFNLQREEYQFQARVRWLRA
jgi:hypothetical protein